MKSTSKAVGQDLAQVAIEAHGGLERWNKFGAVSAHLIQDGVFWGVKGKAGVVGDVTIKGDLRGEKASHWLCSYTRKRGKAIGNERHI